MEAPEPVCIHIYNMHMCSFILEDVVVGFSFHVYYSVVVQHVHTLLAVVYF